MYRSKLIVKNQGKPLLTLVFTLLRQHFQVIFYCDPTAKQSGIIAAVQAKCNLISWYVIMQLILKWGDKIIADYNFAQCSGL